MTSQINPTAINDQYPVAGQPNNTQGFRDNFAGTKTNFEYAAEEITELQTKSILTAALDGGSALTTQNNMLGSPLIGAKIRNFSADTVNIATTSGPITLDYSQGHYQRISTTGNISLGFNNWPVSGNFGLIRIQTIIDTPGRTMTLSPAVTQGTTGIEGYANGTITFGSAGTYQFEFTTSDAGGNVAIFDLNRPLGDFGNPVNISSNAISTSTATGALTVAGGAGITGNLNVGGNLRTYTSTGNICFQVLDNGYLQINTPTVSANSAGALNIVGNNSNVYQNVTSTGCMIHITGNDGASSRIVNDAFGTGAVPTFTTRAARGTAAAPTAIQTNDVIARFGFVGWDGTDFGAPGGAGTGIDVVAIENFTDSAQGTNIKLYTSPATANTKTLSMTIASNVVTFPSNVSVGGSGGVTLTDGGTLGYGVGAGGANTQSGGKSGAVTLNKPSGQITLAGGSLSNGVANAVSFILTNSTIGNTDVMIINHVSGGTIGAYQFFPVCNTGTANITIVNQSTGALNEQPVIRYTVVKGSIT